MTNTKQSTNRYHWPLLGHSDIKQYFQNALHKRSLGHAYIFNGPDNIGKTTLARMIAKTLFCEAKKEKQPCDTCGHCVQFDKDVHTDLHTISLPEDKKNIPIQSIRDLQSSLSLKALIHDYKIVIIEGAEKLSEEASNALLKLLEEPSGRTVFFLITPHADKLLGTIRSRCSIINFNTVPPYLIQNWLVSRGMDKAEAKTISSFSGGRPGVAIRSMDDSTLIELRENHGTLLISLMNARFNERIIQLNNLKKQSEKSNIYFYLQLIDDWISYLRDMMLIRYNPGAIHNNAKKQQISIIAKKVKTHQLKKNIEKLVKAKQYIQQSVNPYTILENFTISL